MARAETLANQIIKAELLRAGHFHGAIHGRTHGDPADGLRHVVSRHELNEHGR